MIFAFPNEYVQKHFILTLTCTSWIALLYLNLLKLNFFEGKIACTKSQSYVAIFGIATSAISAAILLFSDGKFDSAHEDPAQNSGINWFCMMEQCVVALLYLSIIFIEKVVAYLKTLKLCMPNNKRASESAAPPQETNDNFEQANLNTQHIVIPIDAAKVEEVETVDAVAEQTPEDASYEVIPENNKQEEPGTENENQQHSENISETDELLNNAAPTKERHADVGPRDHEDRKDSDV